MLHLKTRKDFLNTALVCKAAGSASSDCRDIFADRFMYPDYQNGVTCYYLGDNNGRPYLHGPWLAWGKGKKRSLQFYSLGSKLKEHCIDDCDETVTPAHAMNIWKTRDFERAKAFNVS